MAPLYDIFFGGGSMGGMLKNDLVNHTDQLEALSKRHPQGKRSVATRYRK